jgi:hypothetical protein
MLIDRWATPRAKNFYLRARQRLPQATLKEITDF